MSTLTGTSASRPRLMRLGRKANHFLVHGWLGLFYALRAGVSNYKTRACNAGKSPRRVASLASVGVSG